MDVEKMLANISESELVTTRLSNELLSRSDVIPVLAKALESGPEKRFPALIALRYASKALISELFPVLFDRSLETNGLIGLVHDRIFRLDRSELSELLARNVEALLSRNDLTWEEYTRVCTLLDIGGFSELLSRVVEHAAASGDPDIQEVAQDYRVG
ncbi:hypothetical protein [Nocardia lasii]|uniref:Uncharacterized protein n=1 Tax=Nocardia lasii TaxID=1616107 RepID=A0ABW1JTZ7_9NOCA